MPTLPFWCFLNVWASLHFLWSVVMVLIHLIVCFTSVVRKGVLFRFQFGLIFFCTSCLSKKKRSILPVRKNCKKPSTWWSWSARHNEKTSSWCSQGERSFWLSRKEAQTCPLRFRPPVKRGRYGIHYQHSNTDKRYWINASRHVFWKIWYKAHRGRIILHWSGGEKTSGISWIIFARDVLSSLLMPETCFERNYWRKLNSIRFVGSWRSSVTVQTCLLKILQSCQLSKSKSSSTNGWKRDWRAVNLTSCWLTVPKKRLE